MSPARSNDPLSPARQAVVREFQRARTPRQRQAVYQRHRDRIAATPMTHAEREVLLRYYDLGQTLAEIGTALHLSRARISQIKARAVRKVAAWPGAAPLE